MGTILTMSMRKVFALLAALALASVAIPTGTAAGSGHGAGPGTAVVVRDNYGVPHVFAHDVHALFYGVGYAQGQDRLWQAELLRRAATGTLAELVGPSAVDGDVRARALFGPRARRDALVAEASPQLRRILHGYAAGMTGWIEAATATGRLPVEFTAAGLQGRIRDRLRVAVTAGIGPRFLHSTGQLHKGGPNSVVALQIVDTDLWRDTGVDIPGRHYDFATLIRAQAVGDLQSLRDHDRRVAQVGVAGPGGLTALADRIG
jgi:acyl-homoserine lactone acylase PvdQ